jgi:hypothetical protein
VGCLSVTDDDIDERFADRGPWQPRDATRPRPNHELPEGGASATDLEPARRVGWRTGLPTVRGPVVDHGGRVHRGGLIRKGRSSSCGARHARRHETLAKPGPLFSLLVTLSGCRGTRAGSGLPDSWRLDAELRRVVVRRERVGRADRQTGCRARMQLEYLWERSRAPPSRSSSTVA